MHGGVGCESDAKRVESETLSVGNETSMCVCVVGRGGGLECCICLLGW